MKFEPRLQELEDEAFYLKHNYLDSWEWTVDEFWCWRKLRDHALFKHLLGLVPRPNPAFEAGDFETIRAHIKAILGLVEEERAA